MKIRMKALAIGLTGLGLVAASLTVGSSAQAGTTDTPPAVGSTLTVTASDGTVTYKAGPSPVESGDEKAESASMATVNDCVGAHSLPCMTVGPQYNTGKTRLQCGPGGMGPCYYVPVYKRSFTACATFMAQSVNLCMNGQAIYSANYAACITRCTIGGLRGYHNCGIPGTGAFGWSVEQQDCSDTYLSSRSPGAQRASVARNIAQVCAARIFTCSTIAFHVNAYPSGTITGPYNGLGAYS